MAHDGLHLEGDSNESISERGELEGKEERVDFVMEMRYWIGKRECEMSDTVSTRLDSTLDEYEYVYVYVCVAVDLIYH